jgi:hypothetical protein
MPRLLNWKLHFRVSAQLSAVSRIRLGPDFLKIKIQMIDLQIYCNCTFKAWLIWGRFWRKLILRSYTGFPKHTIRAEQAFWFGKIWEEFSEKMRSNHRRDCDTRNAITCNTTFTKILHFVSGTRVGRFILVQNTKTRRNITNDHNLYQMAIKYF